MHCRLALITLLAFAASAEAQVTWQDYERALGLRTRYADLTPGITSNVTWLDGNRFWYRVTVPGGARFVLADARTQKKTPAFNQEKVGAALSEPALKLPFNTFQFVDHESAIEFDAKESHWKCDLAAYQCKKAGPAQMATRPFGRRNPESEETEPPNDVNDGMTTDSPQVRPQSAAPEEDPATRFKNSPDKKWDAVIRNFNVFLREHGKKEAVPLSFDGSEGNYYTFQSLQWSPDSRRVVAYRVRPGFKREVHYVESSPSDQLQPKHSTRQYAKPGDALDIAAPVLFDIETKKQFNIENSLFPNPYSLSPAVWRKDSRTFTFEYNQRGHQLYRVIEVDADSGHARAAITEESKTFIDYRPLIPNQTDTGKKFRQDLADGKEIVWLSERDGWAHLYLYDGLTGRVKNQITKGPWVVRAVEKVDEAKRQIWFQASGMYPGKDPYFKHYYRVNFDGSGLTAFTDADANHTVAFSPDMQFYTDEFSRVDQPPLTQLRRAEDRKVLAEIETADASKIREAGWAPPEVFTATGRDGSTDIWGVIWKPAHFDPAKKYPVIETIYAGPQGSFVPKVFQPSAQPLTELGFVVVQIDGMGTNNRSKAFHDVAFKNLKDAGFEDRILWHKAVAAKCPWYDISRVGVFGTSAGGQNAMGALLFHPEFYKAAVANSGCHDNRMDKIWWNEQWMSWPLGPEYAESSNVDNAYRLQGKLLLVVGEMDTNVDPASTFQVVNALMKANKKFDLLYVPGGGHGSGGAYGQKLLFDFFLHNLQGVEPPAWQG